MALGWRLLVAVGAPWVETHGYKMGRADGPFRMNDGEGLMLKNIR